MKLEGGIIRDETAMVQHMEIRAIQGDITKQNDVEAIVNAAVNCADINKNKVKSMIIRFFDRMLKENTMLPSKVGRYLGEIYLKDTAWTDFDIISEDFSLAEDGILSYEDAKNRLCDYFKAECGKAPEN